MSDRYVKYLNYLESEDWKDLRQLAFDAADNRCEACDYPYSLVGHHMVYRTPLTDCTIQDIMCLCRNCHDILHKGLSADKAPIPDDRKMSAHLINFYREVERQTGKLEAIKERKITKASAVRKERKPRVKRAPASQYRPEFLKITRKCRHTGPTIDGLITAKNELEAMINKLLKRAP